MRVAAKDHRWALAPVCWQRRCAVGQVKRVEIEGTIGRRNPEGVLNDKSRVVRAEDHVAPIALPRTEFDVVAAAGLRLDVAQFVRK